VVVVLKQEAEPAHHPSMEERAVQSLVIQLTRGNATLNCAQLNNITQLTHVKEPLANLVVRKEMVRFTSLMVCMEEPRDGYVEMSTSGITIANFPMVMVPELLLQSVRVNKNVKSQLLIKCLVKIHADLPISIWR